MNPTEQLSGHSVKKESIVTTNWINYCWTNAYTEVHADALNFVDLNESNPVCLYEP